MGCLLYLYQFLCFLLFFHLHFLATSSSSSTQLCHHDQSVALLQFNNSFSIDSSASSNCEYYGIASYPKTDSWKEGTDCCSWNGVTCDNMTGHVIGLDLSCSWLKGTIPPNCSLFLLPHLKSLNLASNDFDDSRISPQFGWFKSLMYLNLSYSLFSGQVPSAISHLSKLISLDLSSNWLNIETPILRRIVENLTEIRELFLDQLDLSSVALDSLMNLSSSLTSLSLRECQLQGNFPSNIFYKSKLQLLRLNYNFNLSGYFPKSNWSGPLELLNVYNTLFSGELPDAIGNPESLKYLDLSGCNFTGLIPSSLGNLEQLTHLDLGYNNFTSPIPDVFHNLSKLTFLNLGPNNFGGQLPSSLFNLSQLEFLYVSNSQLVGSIPNLLCRLSNLVLLQLDNNLLNGTIPSWLYTLPSLESIDLSDNKLTGDIKEFQFKSLTNINLANNKLHGPLPSSIFELVNLTYLSLDSNNLSGIMDIDKFSKLKNLKHLNLSYNSLSLVSTNIHVNYTLPNFEWLYLSSCNIIEFPYVLKASKNLQSLDLSKNKIQGQIPKWMWDVGKDSLSVLDLSHNLLTGIEKFPWKNLKFLDLRSNLLQGPLPIPPPIVAFFSISNNSLTGELSSLICNSSFLDILDISRNNLSGIIPPCLGNLSKSLSVLNLQKNNFHGTIPIAFSKGCGLKNLNLNGNQLGGPLPRSMGNCRNLEVVDLGNNKINDTFPYLFGNLPELQVLVLRSNKFHSYIRGSKTHHSFSKLRIFDLSNNYFVGPLPISYIKSFKAMINVSEGKSDQQYMRGTSFSFYYFSVNVIIKGNEFELVKILTIFTSIDLSNNCFEGEIPKAIGKLGSLKGLNVSHNSLAGHIPTSLGNITALESLDLSCNKLVGEIPLQLTSLTFLAVLNLSHNQLVGPIPRGSQFDTFENDSYGGNLGLCGLPLSEKCINDGAPQPLPSISHEDEESGCGFDWKISMMGYGCGLVLGLSMGYIVFSTGKPQWFVRLVEGDRHKKVRRPRQTHQGRRI